MRLCKSAAKVFIVWEIKTFLINGWLILIALSRKLFISSFFYEWKHYIWSQTMHSQKKRRLKKETEFLILLAWFFCVTIKLRENKCFSLSPLVLTRKNTLFIVKKPSHARMLSICQSSCFLYRCYYPLTLTKFSRI